MMYAAGKAAQNGLQMRRVGLKPSTRETPILPDVSWTGRQQACDEKRKNVFGADAI